MNDEDAEIRRLYLLKEEMLNRKQVIVRPGVKQHQIDDLLDHLRAGNRFDVSCKASRLAEETVRQWMADASDPWCKDLAAQIEYTIAMSEAELVASLRQSMSKHHVAEWILEHRFGWGAEEDKGNRVQLPVLGDVPGAIAKLRALRGGMNANARVREKEATGRGQKAGTGNGTAGNGKPGAGD